MRTLLLAALVLLAPHCFPVQPTKAAAQSRYWYGPVVCRPATYCPRAMFAPDCFTRLACRQQICDNYTRTCSELRWWQ